MEGPAHGSTCLLGWLVDSGSEGLGLSDLAGNSLPCTLFPPLPEAIASARRDGLPSRARLATEGAVATAVFVVPVPGTDSVAAAVEAGSDRQGIAPALESLVDQIAHEIRNFAFTIGLQAEMGSRRAADAPDIKGHFDAALRQVDGLKRYLDRLLLYGRAVRLALAPLDAVSFVREQVELARSAYPEGASPTAPTVAADPPSIAVRWDSGALGHAIRAVLDNAMRSAEPPPPIEVSVRQNEKGRVSITVTDRGSGIPHDILRRVAVPMSVRRAGGTGLGLAIARKMVEAHGGALFIESGSGGTTVRFEMPTEATTV